MIDMHTHTTASDGTHRPAEVVRMAKVAGLTGIAITDHDTVGGIQEALEEGRRCGIHVVPGIEISTDGGEQDIHILGYGISIDDPIFRTFASDQREVRKRRNTAILDRLLKLGIILDEEELIDADADSRTRDSSIGRPHIAQALVRKGIVDSVQEAFDRYLAKGRPAYTRPERIAPKEAVTHIRSAGGAAVVAHPGLYKDDALVRRIIEQGIDGIEVYHFDHSSDEVQRYEEWSRRYGLTATGGSDFHGSREGVMYHGGVGARRVPIDVLAQLGIWHPAPSR